MNFHPENLELIYTLFDCVVLEDPRSDTKKILRDTEVLFAPLGFTVNAAKMGLCKTLRAVVSNTTSVSHIDIKAAAKRNVAICALYDEQLFLNTITPTAEHTIGLMLAAWRQISSAHRAVLRGEWRRIDWGAPRMFSRMRLGIVGFGRLGRKVANIAKAMEMVVNYYDPYVDGGVDDVVELATCSDILSIHAVSNEETSGLISESVLKALPKNAMVINTARGELLDTNALLDLMENGHIIAAALDTIDGEYEVGFEANLVKSRLLSYARTHDNLILTPHIGGSTLDAWKETQRRVLEKAAAMLSLGLPA
ncbi:MAG: NAD(P)-dependent oxidoreductase, partial [Alphaproteobacteria bacterium]